MIREPADSIGVLTTTRPVVDGARQVRIDAAAVEASAARLAREVVQRPAWNTHYHWAGSPAATALAVLVLDALNFCFWGEPRWRVQFEGETLDGYWALAACLKRAIQAGDLALDPAALAEIDAARLGAILTGEGITPLLPERVASLRELGGGLRDRWGGDAGRLIRAAGGSAPALARLMAREFPSFNDVATYDGREVRLYKRAQIVVADLWGALDGQGLGAFHDLAALTAFADYKVPQVLRRLGILVYDADLARLVDTRVELPAGSPAEVEIRAATIWGVENLRQALARHGRPLRAFEVDWVLWEAGQHIHDERPYHRTRTIFY
ncbi:MAG: queuosine salvage family protein [Chloroflexi bacterium]|nr:queuosine salvage family protein [Chloroflexota bacterium]